jgi:hypothetical protein
VGRDAWTADRSRARNGEGVHREEYWNVNA